MMKKILTTIVIAVSCAAAFSSCSKQNFDVDFVDPVDAESNDVTISLVSAQDQTKAFLQDDYTFRWDPSNEGATLFERISNQEASILYKYRINSNSFDLTDGNTKANFGLTLPTGSEYYDKYKDTQYSSQVEAMLINNSQFKEGTLFSYEMLYPSGSIMQLSASSQEVNLFLFYNQSPDEFSKVPGKNILLYSHLDASEVRLSGSETRTAEMQYQHLSSYARLNFKEFPSSSQETTAISVSFYNDDDETIPVAGQFTFDLSNTEIINANDTKEGVVIKGETPNVSDGESGFKPVDYWFAVIPDTFQTSKMEVSARFENMLLVKNIPVKSPFKAGKIKVFDLDFTTSTNEVILPPL